MNTATLQEQKIIQGYDAVSSMYVYGSLLGIRRTWKYANYKKLSLLGRLLDIGCGDKCCFQMICPNLTDNTGIDENPSVAITAQQRGVYTNDHAEPACQMRAIRVLKSLMARICNVPNINFSRWD